MTVVHPSIYIYIYIHIEAWWKPPKNVYLSAHREEKGERRGGERERREGRERERERERSAGE